LDGYHPSWSTALVDGGYKRARVNYGRVGRTRETSIRQPYKRGSCGKHVEYSKNSQAVIRREREGLDLIERATEIKNKELESLEIIDSREELLDNPGMHEDLDSGYSDNKVVIWEDLEYRGKRLVWRRNEGEGEERILRFYQMIFGERLDATELETLWNAIGDGI
jgi:hypothetical protein